MKVTYDKKQLKKAAKFLFKNNPFVLPPETVDSIAERIEEHLHDFAKEVKRLWKDKNTSSVQSPTRGFSATRGYFLLAFQEVPKEMIIEILVDPAVGSVMDGNGTETFKV